MIGQWCMVDTKKFCQEKDCQACHVNYFGQGWVEYQPDWDEIDMDLVINQQANGLFAAPLNILPGLSC